MKANIRTCPHCNYKYSVTEFLKVSSIHTFGQSWGCKKCHKPLKFNTPRHILILFLQIAWLFVILLYRHTYQGVLWYLALILILAVGYVGLSLLDTFAVGKEAEE